jgi:hypothetical protein
VEDFSNSIAKRLSQGKRGGKGILVTGSTGGTALGFSCNDRSVEFTPLAAVVDTVGVNGPELGTLLRFMGLLLEKELARIAVVGVLPENLRAEIKKYATR